MKKMHSEFEINRLSTKRAMAVFKLPCTERFREKKRFPFKTRSNKQIFGKSIRSKKLRHKKFNKHNESQIYRLKTESFIVKNVL